MKIACIILDLAAFALVSAFGLLIIGISAGVQSLTDRMVRK